jgi:hypothetical protein
MLCGETVAVCCENRMEHTDTLWAVRTSQETHTLCWLNGESFGGVLGFLPHLTTWYCQGYICRASDDEVAYEVEGICKGTETLLCICLDGVRRL